MNGRLLFCKVRKTQDKDAPPVWNAVSQNGAAMSLGNRLCKRKPKPGALRIAGESAAVKTFENMVDILWVDAAAVIFDGYLRDRWKLLPFHQNIAAGSCIVECIVDQVADGLEDPSPVAKQHGVFGAGQFNCFLFLPGAVFKMLPDIMHHIGDVFQRFFHEDGTRVQSGDL